MKDGARHWLWERATALALIPLTIWFLASIIAHSSSGYGEFVAWLTNPLSMVLMVLLLAALFYHIALGFQVVVDDYVHSARKPLVLMAVRLGCLALAAVGCIAVVYTAFD
ncbi:succinate dehydrogenase, hydrophobic membrane anchor protein [Mesorhizobium atlanticum]|uniref:Succinate dehydrogenase hydrophobic membrane anchor subunit n=1 Tax=Mesorhizobium atlanticum TaxID=2233532 RepID=A0A330GSA7_9HYPH|nr:succinate dehydrogenase, hydrophobic membrane anchor protein [Mesorhizobium atlanticum]RAZ77027.1 succinate dehydrogenase, hydrophobic membrane anchor protein [Mesorhizobium atlanticum]